MQGHELRYTDFSLSAEQAALQETLRTFYRREVPPERVRGAEPLGHDQQLFEQLVKMEAGTMALPTELGGSGAGLCELVVAAEEHGRALAPAALIEHVTALRLLAQLEGRPAGLAEQAARGEQLLTLAMQPMNACPTQLVPAGAVATGVFALDGDDLVLLRSSQPPAHVPNQGHTPLARWSLDTADRLVLESGASAVEKMNRAWAEWKLLTAAALTGLTQGALDLAVEFVKSRRTLGVPLGTLQGISFPLVDVAIGITGARHLSYKAAWFFDSEPGAEAVRLARAAFAYASRAATKGAFTAVHVHGGLGFTVEADVSLYFLRAKGWSALGGDPAADVIALGESLRDRVAQRS